VYTGNLNILIIDPKRLSAMKSNGVGYIAATSLSRSFDNAAAPNRTETTDRSNTIEENREPS